MRNFYWHLFPPANHTYNISESDSTKDWYYAQTHNGTWKIVFDDVQDGNNRTLRIAIASASGSLIEGLQEARLQVTMNENLLFDKIYENDGAIYRGGLQSGNFYAEKLDISANLVIDGTNVVGLTVIYGSFMYDAISYQVNE